MCVLVLKFLNRTKHKKVKTAMISQHATRRWHWAFLFSAPCGLVHQIRMRTYVPLVSRKGPIDQWDQVAEQKSCAQGR